MIYDFHVVHSHAGHSANRPGVVELNPVELLDQYLRFKTVFDQFFVSRPNFGATFKPAVPTSDGLRVSLATDLDALSAKNIVASFIADMNNAVPGLFLVIQPKST